MNFLGVKLNLKLEKKTKERSKPKNCLSLLVVPSLIGHQKKKKNKRARVPDYAR